MKSPQDSTGKPIAVGDRVNWRGDVYTIRGFGDSAGRLGTRTILFAEPLHVSGEVPDEISVDLVETRGPADWIINDIKIGNR